MASDFSMYSGDSRVLTITIRDEEGVAVDVSSTAIVFGIFRADGTQLLSKTLGAGVSVVTSTVTVTLLPADTAGLSGVFGHELQITMPTGVVATALRGEVTIVKDYIQ